jgi:hypothetical protein
MLSITDVKIIEGDGVAALPGWEKCIVDLNEDAGGAWLYIAFQRDPERQVPEHCVTDIDILVGDAPVPTGWIKDPTDLNKDTDRRGSSLHLIYRRDGKQVPLVGIQVIREKANPPRGYQVLPTDLNQGARGSDIFMAYLRQQPTLTIRRLGCISTSSGYGKLAETIVNVGYTALIEGAIAAATRGRSLGRIPAVAVKAAAKTAAKAAVEEAANVAVEEAAKAAATSAGASSEMADAGVDAVNAALGLRSGLKGQRGEAIAGFMPMDTGLFADLLTDGTSAVAVHVGKSQADDVYLRINGDKVWPFTKHGKHDMNPTTVVEVNFVTPFDGPVTVQVFDKDYPFWVFDTKSVAHDVLGEGVFTPGVSNSQIFLFCNADEGSAYLAEILIDDADGKVSVLPSPDMDAAMANRQPVQGASAG